MNSTQDFFDTLAGQGMPIPEALRNKIAARIQQVLDYTPTIGVLGKTGVGKSSLCNALFGQDVCPISNTEACTRNAQEVALGIGQRRLTLLDVPGVGESTARDTEYAKLYQQWLPKLDVVLWIIKADDRAFTSDETFYQRLVRPYVEHGTPFFIVLNQVDKMEPCREWDEKARQPGARQAANIEEKRRVVAGFFELPLDQVVAVSANERFGLVELVDKLIHALPREKRVNVLREVRQENRSEFAITGASEGFLETVVDVVVSVIPIIPEPIKQTIKTAAKKLISIVKGWFS